MKICILSDGYEGSESPLAAVDTPCDPSPYLPGHECHRVDLAKPTAVREVIRLAGEGYDVFFNLCDGAWDEDRPGIEVVQALERLGVAFTGADSGFYEPTREAMKRVCHAWGVPTPAGRRVTTAAEALELAESLRWPLIVKHPSSYSSIGLTPASRVETPADLEREAATMIGAFGAALVEEFIDGREVSVLVAEDPDDPATPTAYWPVEIVFPPGETFKHFELKWVEHAGMDCLPVEDPALAERVMEAARRLFIGIGGTGYGRCDVRVDAAGTPWMLEINPNCGVFYDLDDPGTADLILMASPGGHRAFAEQVVAAALRRRDAAQRAWEVRCDREGNYGSYAARAIPEGGLIERHEEQAQHLVTRRHVEETWGPLQRDWFERYAWPVSEEVWAVWHPDPEHWRPINHSCDPSAWLSGLDVVARRPLAPGEEITLDYATFCGEEMREFVCGCRAADCRRVIRGGDMYSEHVERYGEHVSDYVRRKRAERTAEAIPARPRRAATSRRR